MSIQPSFQAFALPNLARHEAELGRGEIVAVFDGSGPSACAATGPGVATIGPDAGLVPSLTVADNLLFGRDDLSPFAREGLVANALARVGLGAIGHLRPDDLPVAQCAGVALARLFLSRPALLLLTQPFAGLGDTEQAHLFERLAALRRESGLRVLLAPSDLDQALLAADRILVARPAGSVVAAFVNLRRGRPGEGASCGGALRAEIRHAVKTITGEALGRGRMGWR